EAGKLGDVARQTIESNRRYAYPPSVYDDYKQQADNLAQYVEDEHRKSDERRTAGKRTEIEDRQVLGNAQKGKTRQRTVYSLMSQASELRKEHRYDEAIRILQQVLVLDPNNELAASEKEMLEDVTVNTRHRDAMTTRDRQMQDLLAENQESMTPWHQDILYP